MLQELIKKLNDEVDATTHEEFDQAIFLAIRFINEALPQFEEEIKKAYNEGSLSTYKKEPKNGQAQDYFNQNYNRKATIQPEWI